MYPKPTWWYKKCFVTPKRCQYTLDFKSVTFYNVEINRGIFVWSFLVECADRLQNNNYSWLSTWFSKKDHFVIHVFKHEFPTYKNLYRLVKCINRLYIQLLIAKCCRAAPRPGHGRGATRCVETRVKKYLEVNSIHKFSLLLGLATMLLVCEKYIVFHSFKH